MRQTIENLAKAFAGESMARNMYVSFAKIAKKEGFEQIAAALQLTADNEREHASWTSKTKGAPQSDDITMMVVKVHVASQPSIG